MFTLCSHPYLSNSHLCFNEETCLHGQNQTRLPWEPVQALLNQEQNSADVAEEECLQKISQMISQLLHQAERQNRSEKLWVQYSRQVTLLQHIIYAEELEATPVLHDGNDSPHAVSATGGILTANDASK